MLVVEGLKHISTHSQPQWGWKDLRKWSMVWWHREAASKPDYLLATNQQTLLDVVVRDPLHNSDHYMVLVCLLSRPLQEKKSYLGSQWRFPLKLPALANGTSVDTLFGALSEEVLCPYLRTFPRNVWISQETCLLIYQLVARQREPDK